MNGPMHQLRVQVREALDRVAEIPVLEGALRGTFARAEFFPTFRNNHQMILLMKRALRPDSCCVDIGANQGHILHHMLRFAPHGEHMAVEPIPDIFRKLQASFADKGDIEFHNVALANEQNCQTDFFYVRNCPTVSGLRLRMYDHPQWDVERLKVPVTRLDKLTASKNRIDFIKIDVEGGEEGVLRGGEATILRHRPLIVFEHNFHAAPFFHTTAEGLYDYLTETLGMRLTTLGRWLAKKAVLTRAQFLAEFEKGLEQDYLAIPKEKLAGNRHLIV